MAPLIASSRNSRSKIGRFNPNYNTKMYRITHLCKGYAGIPIPKGWGVIVSHPKLPYDHLLLLSVSIVLLSPPFV